MLRHIATFAGVCSWSYAIPHELTHYLTARLATDDAWLEIYVASDTGFAKWEPIESRLLRVFAHLSPTVFGTILMGLWGWSGVPISGWRLIFAIGLFCYTIPSPGDIRGALGRQDVQREA